jgi:hypothetical protein
MKSAQSPSNHPLFTAMTRAQRAGDGYIRNISTQEIEEMILTFAGENPPSFKDLIGSKIGRIGGNSTTEWSGVITPSGRHILYVLTYDLPGVTDQLSYSYEIEIDGKLPSYVGYL